MAGTRERSSKRPGSRLASRVPYSQAVAFRVKSLLVTVPEFRKLVWRFYRQQGRHELPWRSVRNRTVYRILVSEVMLQQTQVDRVISFYKNFVTQFPTAKKLASAPLSDVLKAWQGLGYNRRAKLLQLAAKELSASKTAKGTLATDSLVAGLEKLPGVGPYTARAVAAFAFNVDITFVETNIRTVVIHHFFPNKRTVTDREIEEVLSNVLPKGRSREWYSALMDYGTHLKRSGISYNARSTTHAKQSRFIGSLREARGAILRELSQGPVSLTRLCSLLGESRRAQMEEALRSLRAEKLVGKRGRNYVLAD